jgi:hypothetical protein
MKYIVSIIIFFLFVSASMADEVTVAWDANTESNSAGYNIYAGKMSRFHTATYYIKNGAMTTSRQMTNAWMNGLQFVKPRTEIATIGIMPMTG